MLGSFLLRTSSKYSLNGRAYGLIVPMDTPNPAAWPAFAFLKFTDESCYMLLSGISFLYGRNPTDPLVARERCTLFPC